MNIILLGRTNRNTLTISAWNPNSRIDPKEPIAGGVAVLENMNYKKSGSSPIKRLEVSAMPTEWTPKGSYKE